MASNAKTVMCRNFLNGGCKYGNKCTFAHSQAEITRRPNHSGFSGSVGPRSYGPQGRGPQGRGPCWYFNHGGCTKSADACSYNHIIDPTMKKPLHLQHPCLYFHLRTPGKCTKINTGCHGDHDYVLTEDEWFHHFPNDRRPVPKAELLDEWSEEEGEEYDENGFPINPPNTPELTESSLVVPVLTEMKPESPRVLVPVLSSDPKWTPLGSFNWADDEDDDLFEKLKTFVGGKSEHPVKMSLVQVATTH